MQVERQRVLHWLLLFRGNRSSDFLKESHVLLTEGGTLSDFTKLIK